MSESMFDPSPEEIKPNSPSETHKTLRSRRKAMRTKELQSLWWDWLSTGERLLRSLHEQSTALTLRDMERVQKIQPEVDSMLTRMRKLDAEAIRIAAILAERLGGEPTYKSLLSILNKEEIQIIESISNRVKIVAQNISTQLEKNRTLIENELNYVSGTLSLITKVAHGQQTGYQKNIRSSNTPILLDQLA